MKILALHGKCSNSDLMKYQVSTLLVGLKKQVDYTVTYVNAPFPTTVPCEKGIDQLFKPPYYMWSEKDENSVEAAIEFLIKVLTEQGPFDGIIGFSMGATVASYMTYLYQTDETIQNRLKTLRYPWKWVICLCAGGTRLLGADVKNVKVDIPSIHVHGEEDPHKPSSEEVYSWYINEKKSIVYHQGKHNIPSGRNLYVDVINFIDEMDSTFTQRNACCIIS